MKKCIKCGSHAFNLHSEAIDQGGFCDVHYWQGRAHRAEAQPEQESVFKWRSVFQEMPTEDSYLLFCFGVHVVEGSYTKKGWASLAYGEAQPDFWAYMPPAPHSKRNQELYAMPPQRPWIGLTAQEAADCWTTSATKTWHNFEAALKDKNT